MDKSSAEYKRAKREADAKFDVHSAYKSMWLSRRYRALGGTVARGTKRRASGTSVWRREKWLNLTPWGVGLVRRRVDSPACGTKHPKQGQRPSVCRPSVRINADTPALASAFTRAQVKEAIKRKAAGKRIMWGTLKR